MTNQSRFFSGLIRRPRLAGLICGVTLAFAQLFTGAHLGTAQAATTACTANGATQNCTVTFAYTGAAETWTVPAGVTQATFDLYGAQGGTAKGGKGGRVTATVSVTPGAAYQIRVGGAGATATAGFNGGGAGSGSGGGGGGATDVRTSAGLTSRLLVAGGGGGGYPTFATGGAGGNPNGVPGTTPDIRFVQGGGGGTQSAGGVGGAFGSDVNYSGTAGALGQGGKNTMGGTGGGGGYYGGGGGGKMLDNINPGAGGGGGSSFGPAGATFVTGTRAGNGQVILTYTQPVATTGGAMAGATLGSPGGIAVLVLIVLVISGIVWQRRRSRTG